MKTASRASWTSASNVTSPETIASGRVQAAASRATIGRLRTSRTTRPAASVAIRIAASRESISAVVPVKAKIPQAAPKDKETSTRNRESTKGLPRDRDL